MPKETNIENKDISGHIPAPKEESRLATEHKAHVSGDNKLERYMPAAGKKPTLGPRTGGD